MPFIPIYLSHVFKHFKFSIKIMCFRITSDIVLPDYSIPIRNEFVVAIMETDRELMCSMRRNDNLLRLIPLHICSGMFAI